MAYQCTRDAQESQDITRSRAIACLPELVEAARILAAELHFIGGDFPEVARILKETKGVDNLRRILARIDGEDA